MEDKGITTPRREWPRIPVPPELFDLLIMMAHAHRQNERTMYRFLYDAIQQAYPDDFEKFKVYFNLEAFEDSGE